MALARTTVTSGGTAAKKGSLPLPLSSTRVLFSCPSPSPFVSLYGHLNICTFFAFVFPRCNPIWFSAYLRRKDSATWIGVTALLAAYPLLFP